MISSALDVAYMVSYLLDCISVILAVDCPLFAPETLMGQCPISAMNDLIYSTVISFFCSTKGFKFNKAYQINATRFITFDFEVIESCTD